MKNDLQNFEENLKKKLEEYEFPFDEKNWEKARFMIDASRNNRKPFMFYFISALVVLTIGSGFVYFYNTSSSTTKPSNNLLAFNSNAVLVKEHSSENIQNSPTSDVASNSSNLIPKNENVASLAEINTISNSNNNSNNASTKTNNTTTKASKNQFTDSKISNNSSNNNSNSNTSKTNDLSSANSNPTNTSSSDNGSSSNANSNPATSNSGNSVKETVENATKKTDKTKSSTVTEIPAVLGSNAISNVPRNTNNSTTVIIQNNNKLGNIITPINTTTNSIETTATPTSYNGTKIIDSVGAVVTLTSNTLIASKADSVNTPSIVKSDSSSSASPAPSNPIKVNEPKNYIYVDIGANYLFGWNNNGNQEANGFNITGGLNFQYYFNNITSTTAGIHYNSIGNLTQSTYSVANIKYDFGVQKDITSIKYIRLHYITVPVKVGFNLGKNNIIGVGANLSMLMNSDSQKDKYKTKNSEQPNNTNRLSSSKETGYVTGFNPYDIQASVFYRRKLMKGFSVGAEFYFGLTDIKENTHFKSNNIERAMGAKLTIGYDLFKN